MLDNTILKIYTQERSTVPALGDNATHCFPAFDPS